MKVQIVMLVEDDAYGATQVQNDIAERMISIAT